MQHSALLLLNGTSQHSQSKKTNPNHNWLFSSISHSLLGSDPYQSNLLHQKKLAHKSQLLFGEFDGVATKGPWYERVWNTCFADDLNEKTQCIYNKLTKHPHFNKLSNITIIGNSRGGYSALLIAMLLKQHHAQRKLKLHLILNDPVDGPGGTYCAELPDLSNHSDQALQIYIDTLLPTTDPKLYFYQLSYRLMRSCNNMRTYLMNCTHSAACYHPKHQLHYHTHLALNAWHQRNYEKPLNQNQTNTTTLLYNLIIHSIHDQQLSQCLTRYQPTIIPKLSRQKLYLYLKIHHEHVLEKISKLPNPATTYVHEHHIPHTRIVTHLQNSLDQLNKQSYENIALTTGDLTLFNQNKSVYEFIQQQQQTLPHSHSVNFFTQPFILIYYYLHLLINALHDYLLPRITPFNSYIPTHSTTLPRKQTLNNKNTTRHKLASALAWNTPSNTDPCPKHIKS